MRIMCMHTQTKLTTDDAIFRGQSSGKVYVVPLHATEALNMCIGIL